MTQQPKPAQPAQQTFKVTGDLIRLSDLFRRAATFDDPAAAATLTELGRHFANAVSWIYPEYPDNNMTNRNAARMFTEVLTQLDAAAQGAGIAEVILPLRRNSGDPSIDFIKRNALKGASFATKFSFAAADYREDLSAVGAPRAEIETMLTPTSMGNVLGYLAVSRETKRRWADEKPYSPQLQLDL